MTGIANANLSCPGYALSFLWAVDEQMGAWDLEDPPHDSCGWLSILFIFLLKVITSIGGIT